MQQSTRLTIVYLPALAGLFASASLAGVTEVGDVTDTGTTKIVGDTGVGSFTVDSGVSAFENTMRFGDSPTGNGTGLVTGAGTSLELTNGVLNIANGGTGLFTISVGAGVTITRDPSATGSQGGFLIGQPAGSIGELVVTGAGSSLTGFGPRGWMGGDGQATLTVEDNATVRAFGPTQNNPSFRVAQNPGGQATINVRSGGELDFTGMGNDVLFLPERGTATVNIESGGQLRAGRVRVAQVGTASSDINITGAGSEFQAEFFFAAQDPDTVVTVDIEDQGRLDVSEWLYIGQEGTGTMNVSGASTVNVDQDFFVGGEIGAVAGNGSVTVTDGSSVTVGDDLYIGTDISTGVLSLFGADTTLTVGDRLYVGWGFAGFPATGTLEVGRGAVVEATAGEGLNYADAGGDQATGRFVIGDDGTGTVSSGLIEA
ncbi:MAG: hypothetical protein AAGI46_15560, partial [Planctomycetota bacterium]